MDNNPEIEPVNTPAIIITKIDTKDNLFPGIEDYYIRDKNGQCFEVPGIVELFQHFVSDNGYRISFPVDDNKIVTIWRKIYRTPEEIAEENAAQKELFDYCELNCNKKETLSDRVIYHFHNDKTIEIIKE